MVAKSMSKTCLLMIIIAYIGVTCWKEEKRRADVTKSRLKEASIMTSGQSLIDNLGHQSRQNKRTFTTWQFFNQNFQLLL